MSNQLSKECIEAIENESNIYSKIPYDNVCFERGAEVAITNPSIYEKANLISLDEAFLFAEWYANTYDPQDPQEEDRYTMSQIFDIYKNK